MQQQSESSKPELRNWNTLGGRADRNKENNAIPAKWTSHKVLLIYYSLYFNCHISFKFNYISFKFQIPQRPVARTAAPAPALPCIEVFVDEECLGSVIVNYFLFILLLLINQVLKNYQKSLFYGVYILKFERKDK